MTKRSSLKTSNPRAAKLAQLKLDCHHLGRRPSSASSTAVRTSSGLPLPSICRPTSVAIAIGEAIGRLNERYPRVSRYHTITYDSTTGKLKHQPNADKKAEAEGVHTSWATMRKTLSTHQFATIVLPTDQGKVLRIRKGMTPEPAHVELYRLLNVPQEIMHPIKTWS
jgi:hypothetical protein